MSRAVEAAREVVERLLGLGAAEAVLAPGSRSGPLALALHAADAQGLIRLHVRVDEREAGFLALGLAKGSGRPVPVVTTSGTAVANLHPAMLEARHARVPVIAITADRPGQLRGTGANQTTEQRGIFPGIRFVEAAAELAGLDAPQHLNLELDEPLVEAVEWDFSRGPFEGARSSRRLRDRVRLGPGPLMVVVAGDGAAEGDPHPERWGYPVFAEPSSGLRDENAIAAYRLLLGGHPLAERIERVVCLGHPTLSRPVSGLLARADLDIVHVGDKSTFPGEAAHVRFVESVEVTGTGDPAWLAAWRRADRRARAAIRAQASDPLRLAATVWQAAAGGTLVVGSSSVVRDLDLIAAGAPPARVIANRGLAGIDGMLSTAIGAALAAGRPAFALVGDLTFCHGANGLLIGPGEPRPDLTIVVASDDGGAIFSLLEQGDPAYADAFERIYATPTGTDLAALCRAHGVPHRRVAVADLPAALDRPRGLSVVEVPLDRRTRRSDARRLAAAVRETYP
ncbi:MAG: thiamine pyrophosphate-binding protein [Aeromicrobium sp.]|uniref:2-succinyl-5-enolpyruvyl-6-hydroxy-3- cyclohexene-1-carboxylate synthase n=1 Tax=Aeromicrobium sp. TaxID=1871063 RepID=UPI0039E2CA62